MRSGWLNRGNVVGYVLVFAFFPITGEFFVSHALGVVRPSKAGPDQVLVLYNADWGKDVDGSDPGQDSREVAEHYVQMHTDHLTGKKPYLLGLKCIHRKSHLNDWVINEDSQDNKDGVEYKGEGAGPRSGEWARDSRHVEIVIDPKDQSIDWDSVHMWCQSTKAGEKRMVVPQVTGAPEKQGRKVIYPPVQEGKGRCFRFNARDLFKGTVMVGLQARSLAGDLVRDLRLIYYDIDDFVFSPVGNDGISDEKFFQEDVALPVKRFLEDTQNTLPDGTLLKDHILYIVICHGLPFSCEGVFGIERGVTPRPADHGDLGSLEQRLQTLYYAWGEDIMPPVLSMYMSGGPDSQDGVRNYRISSAMRYPLFGQRWNPYMHPDTYSFLGSKEVPQFIDIPPLNELRKKYPSAFLAYGVSRVDGPGPREAKRQIDYALYASKYLRPEMDLGNRINKGKEAITDLVNLSERLKKAEKENLWGAEDMKCLGFRVLSTYAGQGIPFLGRPFEDFNTDVSPVGTDDQNNYAGYYPGGMDRTVASSNGWNMGRHAAIWRQVDEGITVSACGGPAYGGGPHITNATFWDNRILMRYLFRGRDLGECFLLSTCYVNWSTSLLGDPLLHPDLSKTVVDSIPPKVANKEDIDVRLTTAMGRWTGEITIPIVSSNKDPEVAKLSVFYRKQDEAEEKVSHWPFYSTEPKVLLRDLDPDAVYLYRPILTDPYGNSTDLEKLFGRLSFHTRPLPDKISVVREANERRKYWQMSLRGLSEIEKAGTIRVKFVAGENGCIPTIQSTQLSLLVEKWPKMRLKITMSLGGPRRTWFLESPLKQGETAQLVLRWRRFPLTREVALVAGNGSEFPLAADTRTPWEEMNLRDPIQLKEGYGSKVVSASVQNDALPACKEACRIKISPLDCAAWAKANQP